MSDNIRIIPLSDPEAWRAAIADRGRPSHAWGYLAAISPPDALAQLAVVSSGGSRMLLPFIEREWQGCVDIATPVGLSGASIDPPGGGPLDVWREYARERGWVAGYIQLADDAEIGLSSPGDRIVTGNEVFLLDLDGVDPIAQASEIVRRKVRRARDSGVELVTDRTLLGEHLARLYPPSMERLGASEAYRYDQASLKALALAPEALVVGAMLDGEVEAVSVFLRAGHRAEYLCNGSSERGRDLASWLIAQAAALLREEGVKELNLGGGITPDDGLHQFKARFNGRLQRLRAACQVYDPARYASLCASRGVDPVGRWFPAYRAPAADN